MGKGKQQRVIIILFLLFLVVSANCVILYNFNKHIQHEDNRKLGILINKHPELEKDLIEVFEGDRAYSNSDVDSGKFLEDKYGYTIKNRKSTVFIKTYTKFIVMSILPVGVFVLLIDRSIQKREDRSNIKYIEDIIQCIRHYKDNIYSYKFEEHDQKSSYSLYFRKLEKELYELGGKLNVLRDNMVAEERDTKEMVTDISHQLKTPLASLKMSYEIADINTFSEEERSSFLAKGFDEIKKLEGLLDALINVSRLEANMIEIKPTSYSIKTTLKESVSTVFMKAFDKNIEIITEEFEDINILHDPKWTREAFVNVLDNAVKYSESGTSIKLKVQKLINYIIVEIEDEGIGIDKSDYTKIFKRFYRGNAKKVVESEGSGVGLYLVRRILEEQGGSIRVKKSLSGGSVFQLTLPIEKI